MNAQEVDLGFQIECKSCGASGENIVQGALMEFDGQGNVTKNFTMILCRTCERYQIIVPDQATVDILLQAIHAKPISEPPKPKLYTEEEARPQFMNPTDFTLICSQCKTPTTTAVDTLFSMRPSRAGPLSKVITVYRCSGCGAEKRTDPGWKPIRADQIDTMLAILRKE